ncbi:MAG: VOC family protein [Cyclobacteriaceae bacterium]|nr:VOC family protein [Cyclobacteriaceae bacterium]
MNPFHIAFPVNDLAAAHTFYINVLGCSTGRTSDHWIDFNLYGHQVVAHLAPEEVQASVTNAVDGHSVPVRHFGVVLPWNEWQQLAEKLKGLNIDFIIEPYIRFEGEVGEQATLFIADPSGNALEFKSFKNMDQLFAH